MGIRVWHVNAFADPPFAGNPAAVCLLEKPRDDRRLQEVARRNEQTQTAFLLPMEDGFQLRWFTPAAELELCGHATLASAHVLWNARILGEDRPARFHTRSGLLTAELRGEWVELNFPALSPSEQDPPEELRQALNARIQNTGRNRLDILVELSSEAEVLALSPDFERLRRIPIRGVIATARAERQPFDFVSRFFAPRAGIDEDPVTGSAHCCLGPYWHARLGRNPLLAYQASARGGVVRVRLEGDRVRLGGKAVTVREERLPLDG